MIAPDQEFETALDMLGRLKVNEEYWKSTITLSYRDLKDNQFDRKYEVDLKDFSGSLHIKKAGLHEVFEALNTINKVLAAGTKKDE
ncbi:hypothetical protein LG326_03470 [Metaplanococcus flavidus]